MEKTGNYVKDQYGTMFFQQVRITREEAENLHRYGQVRPSWLKMVAVNYDDFTDVFSEKRMRSVEAYKELVKRWTPRADEVFSHLQAFTEGLMDLIDMVFLYCVGHKQCRQFIKDVFDAAGMDADVDSLWKQHKKYVQRDTTMALYGVAHTAMKADVQKKRRDTNLLRYAAENPMGNPGIREKLRKRTRTELGVDYAFQTVSEVPKWQKKLFDTLTADPVWKKILQDAAGDAFGPSMFGDVLPVGRRDFVISELSNTHVEDLIRLWNEKTGQMMTYPDNRLFQLPFAFSKAWLRYYDRLGILCVPGHYYDANASIYEKHVAEFLNSLGVVYVMNHKKELGGLEIDFYIPDKRIGIEVNSNVSHNSNLYALTPTRSMFTSRKEPPYHYDKYLRAKDAGIILIQLFGNDLEPSVFRNVTVKRLSYLITGAERKLPARKVDVRRLTTEKDRKAARVFLNQYHSQGASRASEYWAFSYRREWLGIASFADKGGTELKRLCFLPGVQVVGGLSKLIARYFREHPECTLIRSYSDNNLGSGEAYRKAGAKFIRETGPSLKFISPTDGRDCYSWQIATSWGASGGVVGNDAADKGIGAPVGKEAVDEYIETMLSHRYDDGCGYDRIYTAGSKLWHFERGGQ